MKKITIKDIAKYANTSKTTVSFYLNGRFKNMSDETKERIEKVIKEYNYTPSALARGLSIQKTNLVGVLVGDITNSFSNQLVKGIEDKMQEHGYQIVIGSSNYDSVKEEQFIQRMIQIGVDGFIVQPTVTFDSLVDVIKKRNKDLVFIDSNLTNDDVASVKTDNYTSVFNTIEKIVLGNEYNHYILIGADPKDLSTRLERTAGFLDCMKKYDLDYQSIIVSNNAKVEEVEQKIKDKIDLDRRTLIFVPNCWLLPTLYLALKQYHHLIPNTLGILGFDNTEWSEFVSPSVTTIVQPAFEEGKVVAQKVIDLVENNEVLKKEILVCDVNWQQSVKMK